MPKVKIRLTTGVAVPSRRRAGLIIYGGQPQEFDVTDEQYLTLLEDDKLQVTEVADETSAKPKTKAEKLAAAAEEGLELDVTESNTVAEIDEAINAARAARQSGQELPPAGGEGNDELPPTPPADQQGAAGTPAPASETQTPLATTEGQESAANGQSEQVQTTETPAIPATEAAIKKHVS